jgi:hypothetical protein
MRIPNIFYLSPLLLNLSTPLDLPLFEPEDVIDPTPEDAAWPSVHVFYNFEAQLQLMDVEKDKLSPSNITVTYIADSDHNRERFDEFIGHNWSGSASKQLFYDHQTGNALSLDDDNYTCKQT